MLSLQFFTCVISSVIIVRPIPYMHNNYAVSFSALFGLTYHIFEKNTYLLYLIYPVIISAIYDYKVSLLIYSVYYI